MAEKLFTNVRLGLKVDTLENWGKSSLVLKKGEVAFATVAASAGTGLTEPVCMMKIGDGESTFSELDFNFYAKASDVLAAAKDTDKLTAFINGVIADAGIASDDAMQELAGKVTTAEGKITTLEGKMTAVEGKAAANEAAIATLNGLVGDQDVATRINNAIAALKLSETYEVKGEAAKVQSALDTYKNTTDAKILEHTNAISGNTNAISAIKDGESIDSFADVEAALATKEAAGAAAAAEAAAKSYADGLAGNYDAKGSAAAAESAAKAYADGLAGNYDAAGSAADALADAKDYTDAEIAEWVGDTTVAAQIEALKLSETYEAKGAAAAAESAAKAHATGLNTAMNTRVEALEAIDHEHANAAELAKIADGDVAKWNAAEQNAKSYADGLDAAMDLRVDALEAKFGEGEGNVESQIAAAVEAEAKLRSDADTGLSNRIKAVEDDYLKKADKDELAEDIADLAELIGDGGTVPAQIEAAVAAEAEIARAAEKANADAIKAIKDDYLVEADKTELVGAIATAKQEAIATVLGEGTDADFDTLKEVADWILSDTTGAAALQTDVAAIKADYLKAADKTELEGKITAAQNAADAAQGEVDALEEVVATKAAASDVTTLAGRVTTVEGKVSTLEGEMDTAQADILALEGLVGDTAVDAQITAAIEALKIGDYAKAADLTAAVARIAQNETDIAALKGRMDTAEEDIIALEEEVSAKANDADLAAVAKSGLIDDLSIGEGTVLVFDCGDAGVTAAE